MSTERLTKARVGLIVSQPFFGTLAMRLELVADDKVKACVCDGKKFRFNSEWAQSLSMAELEGALAHSVMSCAMGHHLRRGQRDSKTWNDASDYAINPELERAGFKLPPGSLLDPQYDGQHAEAIYAALRRQDDDKGQQQPQQQPGGQQAGAGASQSSPSTAPQEGGTGEGATGNIDDAQDESGQPLDADEVEAEAEDWAVATAQAAQVARGAGKLPGCVERQMDSLLSPMVAWQEALQRYYQSRAKDDYNWSKRNRRYAHSNLFMPSLDSVKMGALAFAFDMSGSIDQKTVDQFCAEVEEARSVCQPEEVIVMCFNTRVTNTLRFQPGEPIVIVATGKGGTAFDDPVRVLNELEVVPEVLCYLTDLDSSVFPAEPTYPVLWVSTKKKHAPFGEVIMM